MKLKEVNSSTVKAIGYDSGTLYVVYNGGTYTYKNVPPMIYEGLLKADSKGKYLNENVKSYFKYEKLGGCFEFEIEK